MIIDAIVQTLFGILTGIFGLLPAWELPGSMVSLGGHLGNVVSGVNGVFPIVTLGTCIGIMLGARMFMFLWGLVVWVYEHIPFKAT